MSSFTNSWFFRYRVPLTAVLALRLGTSLWLAFVWFQIDPHFPTTNAALIETYNHIKPHSSLIARMFLDVWLRWDAVHYMNIAWGGYEGVGAADMNYWPLYPYLVRILNPLFFHEIILTGLIVSTIAAAIAAVYLWKLVLLIFDNEELAKWTLLAWVIYPTSLFLVAPFTDSLYACLAIASIYAIYRKKWMSAGILSAFSCLARAQGILLTIPFFLAIVIEWAKTRQRPTLRAITGLAIAPLGAVAFLLWRSAVQLPNIVSSFSIYTQARIVDPFTGLFLAIQKLIQVPNLLMVSELVSVLFFLGMQIWMLYKPLFRKEIPLMTYGLLNTLLILVKHIEIASPLQSANRYVLNVIPAFIGIGWLLLNLPAHPRRLIVSLSIAGAMIANVFYALWIFIG